MNINRTRYLLVALTLLVGCITVFVSTTSAQDIHVLMVIDDANPKTEKLRTIDRHMITGLMGNYVGVMLEKQRPGATVKMTELLSKDNQAKRDNIFNWLQNVNPGPDGVIFVYFSVPGGVDEAGTKGRFLLVQGEKLYRKEIATLIEGMQCRLKIFITDTYHNSFLVEFPPLQMDTLEYYFDDLFLEHEGFLNLTSASPGQLSIGNSNHGGNFTFSLIEVIFYISMFERDRNLEDDFISWEEVFELIKVDMSDYYKGYESVFPQKLKDQLKQRNQTTQTPEVLSEFPKRIRSTSAQDIHVLMVIDDANPKTEKLRTIDRHMITGLMGNYVGVMLEKQRPGATVKMTELLSKDNQAKRDNIFNWLQNVNPGPDGVIFVYFSVPGGVDEAGTKGRFLLVQGEKLYRKEIATLIEGMQCRLKIFITDTYHNSFLVEFPPLQMDTLEYYFDDLFLEHEGFLNLTSASPGQLSIGSSSHGGTFTFSLTDGILPEAVDLVDQNPKDDFVSWEEVFEFTTASVDELFQAKLPEFKQITRDRLKRINQTTQTPEVLSKFPKRIR